MYYGTLEEFATFLKQQELVQQSNWEPSELFVNQEFSIMHLESASALINGRLAKRYTVPIIPHPQQLKTICWSIAHHSQERLGVMREHIQEHYEFAVANLDRIASGEDALIGADGSLIIPITELDDGSTAFSYVGQRPLLGNSIDFGVGARSRY